MCAIASGFAGLVLLGAYIIRTEELLKVISVYVNHAGHISIYKKNALDLFISKPRKYQISGSEQKRLIDYLTNSYPSEVEFVAPFLKTSGLISNGRRSLPFLGTGLDLQKERLIQNHPAVEKWQREFMMGPYGNGGREKKIYESEGSSANEGISVTTDLAGLLGLGSAFEVQLAARSFSGDLNAVNAEVKFHHTTGYFLTDLTSLVAPIGLLQELYDTDGVSYLAVYLKLEASIGKILREVKIYLGHDYDVYPFHDEGISQFYVGSMSFIFVMSVFFVVLIFGAVVLSVVNSLTMGIIERTREIGTLRSLGYRPEWITRVFVWEGVFLTIGAIAVGGIFAKLISWAVNALHIRFRPPGLSAELEFVVIPEIWMVLLISVPLILLVIGVSYLVTKNKTKSKIVELLIDSGA